jgi:hypothetical protein
MLRAAENHLPPFDSPYALPARIQMNGVSEAGPLTANVQWASPIALETIAPFCQRPLCEYPVNSGS